MTSRNISESIKKRIAGKQYYKCANYPNSDICKLENYECPLWAKNGNNKGCFDESGYDIDHIEEYSKTKNNSEENLQALCKSCHTVKTKRFMNTTENKDTSSEKTSIPKRRKKISEPNITRKSIKKGMSGSKTARKSPNQKPKITKKLPNQRSKNRSNRFENTKKIADMQKILRTLSKSKLRYIYDCIKGDTCGISQLCQNELMKEIIKYAPFTKNITNKIMTVRFFDIHDKKRIMNADGIRQITKYMKLINDNINDTPAIEIMDDLFEKNKNIQILMRGIEKIKKYKYYIECRNTNHIFYSNTKIKKCKKCKENIYKIRNNIFYKNKSYEAFYKKRYSFFN